MSTIIRDTYTRAILENNPIPAAIDTEIFEDTLKRIVSIFGKNLEDVLEDFSLKDLKGDLSDYLIERTIKNCLPKNPLYQGSLIYVNHSNDLYRGSYSEKTFRVSILSQKDNLRQQDPVWVWENKETVDKFMAIDNPYYRKLKMVEALFPLEISYFE